MNDLGLFQSDVPSLDTLSNDRYESIFKIYKVVTEKNNIFYFYNILRKIEIPSSLDNNIIEEITLDRDLPWTTFSYQLYGTQFLWWLIFLLNRPKNIFYAEASVTYKFITPNYIPTLLDQIDRQVAL